MTAIDECTFAVVDVETTGIDANHHRIVEIAVLTCDWTGAVVERFETLVHPDDAGLTGARADMLAEAPAFADVAGDILARLAGGVVAGHNVSFDLRFIDAELARLGLRLPSHSYVCTRDLATLLGCDVANRTLAALCVYFGVAFDRWHTAADDTTATAAVLASLLSRATGYGRIQLSAIESRWSGSGLDWPELPTGGPVLVRDVVRWPPAGDQPGSRRAKEASFRRLGKGPASPSGAVVVSEPANDEVPARSASELWWQGDFRGLEGITQLQDIVVPAFRTNNDPELITALLALADLLRRHGGRDAEVRASFEEAYGVAAAGGDGQVLDTVVEGWWAYLATLRDVDGMVHLMGLSDRGPARARAQVIASRGEEPAVAEQLARGAVAALAGPGGPTGPSGPGRRGDGDAAGRMLVILAEILETAGQRTDAEALIEEAWAAGSQSTAVLDRLSRHLEQSDDAARALEVCARALAHPTDPNLIETLRKRHRRCQERLARSATLFG
jgi:DNA polymerase III epsilon subunit family exonuclease